MALSADQISKALAGIAKADPRKVDYDGFFMSLKKKGATLKQLQEVEDRLAAMPRFAKASKDFKGVAGRIDKTPVPGPAPKPKGGKPPKPKAPSPAGRAGIRARLAGLAGRFKPTLGGAAALGGLGFLASAALSDQKERQTRAIQRGLVNPALGQNILAEIDRESQMGTTQRLNTMASLMEAGQAMTPQEAELSAILGAAGAAAAQNAAVGRNLDEVALDNVLRMT